MQEKLARGQRAAQIALDLEPLHAIYDYPRYFAAANLRSESVERFRVNALFPVSFEAITAVKI